jgi:hypothetical protein
MLDKIRTTRMNAHRYKGPIAESLLTKWKRQYRLDGSPQTLMDVSPQTLIWRKETDTSIVTTCARYRITKQYVPDEDLDGFFVTTLPPNGGVGAYLAGPFITAREAREAATSHSTGNDVTA